MALTPTFSSPSSFSCWIWTSETETPGLSKLATRSTTTYPGDHSIFVWKIVPCFWGTATYLWFRIRFRPFRIFLRPGNTFRPREDPDVWWGSIRRRGWVFRVRGFRWRVFRRRGGKTFFCVRGVKPIISVFWEFFSKFLRRFFLSNSCDKFSVHKF